MHTIKTPAEISKIFGCTVEQARHQLRSNAVDLRLHEVKARSTGKKVRGYTADQLRDRAAAFEKAAEL